jgi:Holliday junction DNA helicase RuvA
MIGSLRGRLLHRGAGEVLVEVGGVGYVVVTAPTTAVSLGEVGEEVFVWVHHHVREDAETLYGFAGRDERVTFDALLGAHGVGPSLALAILSVHEPGALARILVEDDVSALCLVPGVGPKTAARLLVELKSRLDIPALGPVPAAGVAAPVGVGERSVLADVRDALAGLGYSADEIRSATAELSAGGDGDGDAAVLLRRALAQLAAARA